MWLEAVIQFVRRGEVAMGFGSGSGSRRSLTVDGEPKSGRWTVLLPILLGVELLWLGALVYAVVALL
jgi:hypothetical protein